MRLILIGVLAGALAASATAGETVVAARSATFKCPVDPKATPTTKWVRDTPAGPLWCDDGAVATVTFGLDPGKLTYKGGICTSATTGKFISIGVIGSGDRAATDPPGFKALKWTKATGTPQAVWFARKGKFEWRDETPITWVGLKGSWSGSEGMRVGDVFKDVKAKATFTCKRIVKTSF